MTLHDRFNPGNQPSPVQVKPFTRTDLAKLFSELWFNEGAEIGVFTGEYSIILLRANPSLHLRCVDSWAWSREGEKGHHNTYWASSKVGRPRDVHEANFERTKHRLREFPAVQFMRMLSHEAAAQIPDGSLDFVYVDAEHTYEACLADLRAWSPKVKSGGIVSGDDYRFVNPKRPKRWRDPYAGVDRAVEQFVQEAQIAEWFYTSDAERTIQGIRYAEPGRAFPSFFWLKP
jgi:hypothetical protein